MGRFFGQPNKPFRLIAAITNPFHNSLSYNAFQSPLSSLCEFRHSHFVVLFLPFFPSWFSSSVRSPDMSRPFQLCHLNGHGIRFVNSSFIWLFVLIVHWNITNVLWIKKTKKRNLSWYGFYYFTFGSNNIKNYRLFYLASGFFFFLFLISIQKHTITRATFVF